MNAVRTREKLIDINCVNIYNMYVVKFWESVTVVRRVK